MTDFDRLIDDAARDMTAAPAPVDLRDRVIEQLRGTSFPPSREASADRRSLGGGGQARPAGADEAKASYHWWLAAAAGILLAVYLGWPERQPVEHPTPSAVAQAPTQSSPSQAAAPPLTPDRPLSPTRARRAGAASAPEPTVAALPALETPAAIRIEPLDAITRPVPALDAAAPLGIEQLNITPLTPPGQAAGGQ